MRTRGKAIIVLSSLLLSGVASAQEPGGHGPGIGIEQNLGGLTGAAFVYDAGRFHIDLILGIASFKNDGPDTTIFGAGARFFFVVHDLGAADFSLGAGLGLVQTEFNDDSDTTIQVEAAAQIRAFIVPNVCITASLGLVLLTADERRVGGGPVLGGATGESAFGIGGQLLGNFGITYFFR
jgi:hypothetical protein